MGRSRTVEHGRSCFAHTQNTPLPFNVPGQILTIFPDEACLLNKAPIDQPEVDVAWPAEG